MDATTAVAGLAAGAGIGFVLQRGRLCLNTALRNLFYIGDATLIRSFLLALLCAVLGAITLQSLGLLHLQPLRTALAWPANIAGGFLFGVGMALAGSDAAGAWYKAGEGLVGSWFAVFGIALGAAAADRGVLAGAAAFLREFSAVPGPSPAEMFGLDLRSAAIVVAVLLAAAVFLFRPQAAPAQAGPSWRLMGALLGAAMAANMALAEFFDGAASGVNVPQAAMDLARAAASAGPWNWDMAVVAGLGLGAFAGARTRSEFAWRAPRADTLMVQLLGGLLMGIGGVMAGGCSMSHGIAGLAALSPASMLSVASLVLGNWTMVYLLLIRGARE